MKKNRRLLILLIILAGALVASLIMRKLSSNQSWVAFAGWIIFFIVIQLPWISGGPKKYYDCTTWFSGLKKKFSK